MRSATSASIHRWLVVAICWLGLGIAYSGRGAARLAAEAA